VSPLIPEVEHTGIQLLVNPKAETLEVKTVAFRVESERLFLHRVAFLLAHNAAQFGHPAKLIGKLGEHLPSEVVTAEVPNLAVRWRRHREVNRVGFHAP
jgi:hypothetical protein